MTIAFFDTECNSLDTDHGFIQEIGWAIYDAKTKRLLKSRSHLLKWNMQYEVDEGAFETTGLSRAFCEEEGENATQVLLAFIADLEGVDAICGHNIIDYDIKMLGSNIPRCCFSSESKIDDLPKLDTMYDLPLKRPFKSMMLEYLAMKHGHIMSGAHQALADVFACAHVFFSYPLEEILAIASTPIIKLHGYTDYLDEVGREKFYKAKFRWNREAKRWEKTARAYHIPGTQLDLSGYNLFSGDSIVRVTQPEIPF